MNERIDLMKRREEKKKRKSLFAEITYLWS